MGNSGQIMKETGHAQKIKHPSVANGTLSKFIDPAAYLEKEELLDRLYWSRQIIGLVCGIIWGCIPLMGALWIAVFTVLSSGAIYTYYNIVLKVDEEDFNGHGTLLQEGMFTSIMLFLLSWILIYSSLHF